MMRSEAEIRRALAHLEECQANADAVLDAPEHFKAINPIMIDLFRWVLKQPAKFDATLNALDQVDRDREKHINS